MENRHGYFNMMVLKKWSREHLPSSSPLRLVILMEKDFVEDRHFIGMLRVYLKLVDLEQN